LDLVGRLGGLELSQAAPAARRVLVLNAGSSTLKASVLDVASIEPTGSPGPAETVAIEWGADQPHGADVDSGVAGALARLGVGRAVPSGGVVAVAHRVVYGGTRFTAPTTIDDAVLDAIEALAPLAPLHNPIAAATIRSARAELPGTPHVAVFDTAFHATLPETVRRYPVPVGWDAWGVRRYGFHGLSVAWSVERAATLLDRPARDLGLVVAHLGGGCSVTAVEGGRSVSTSMGMTPLEGLMMGTRAGSIDPGIILTLLRDGRLSLDRLTQTLDHESGLLGVSGSSSDMRVLEAAADGGDGRAALAIEMFVDRAGAGIAAATTSLARLDGIVFTGGIGEHAGRVRAAIVARLVILGVDPIETAETGLDRILGRASGSGPAVLRIEAREDIIAAREALAAIG
jgi:acetate kinase